MSNLNKLLNAALMEGVLEESSLEETTSKWWHGFAGGKQTPGKRGGTAIGSTKGLATSVMDKAAERDEKIKDKAIKQNRKMGRVRAGSSPYATRGLLTQDGRTKTSDDTINPYLKYGGGAAAALGAGVGAVALAKHLRKKREEAKSKKDKK
jgi:hypothetical protein